MAQFTPLAKRLHLHVSSQGTRVASSDSQPERGPPPQALRQPCPSRGTPLRPSEEGPSPVTVTPFPPGTATSPGPALSSAYSQEQVGLAQRQAPSPTDPCHSSESGAAEGTSQAGAGKPGRGIRDSVRVWVQEVRPLTPILSRMTREAVLLRDANSRAPRKQERQQRIRIRRHHRLGAGRGSPRGPAGAGRGSPQGPSRSGRGCL